MKLPYEYEERMRGLLGDEADSYFASLDTESTRALRINPVKLAGDVSEISEPSLTPTGIENVFLFDGAAGGKNPLHHAGAYYIQELSAMLPVLSAPIREGWRVLDLCAAPGGKTGQLAGLVGESGLVVTNEYSPKRARVLLGNVERMGYKNCAVYNLSPDRLCPAFAGYFDLVLVDAPCSGEGMFRKEPCAVADWSVENSAGCASRQREILRSAAETVRDGGYLLYSTCTFSREEDEGLIASFLREHPQFSLVSAEPPSGAGELCRGIPDPQFPTELCLRAYPHKTKGEGQFFGLMRRDGAPVISAPQNRAGDRRGGRNMRPQRDQRALSAAERSAAEEFLGDFLEEMQSYPMCVIGGDIFITATEGIPSDGLLCNGVRLGSIAADGRLVPHHHFFSAYGRKARIKLELGADSELLRDYLHGEGFPLSSVSLDAEKGWGVVTVLGCAVGGIRIAGGYVKNHYPKGLRS